MCKEFKPYGAVPNNRQMAWYRRGKTAMFHFSVNTFTGKEWGDGTDDPSVFNPQKLDCRQWISSIKEAGFTAAILTAKHHDGFCLWPSKYTDYSIKNSPYKNGNGDIVKEFTDACREYGVQPGIYLSPWDRNHKQWGTQEYSDYYANQLTELMTEYGDIYECWWDGAGSSEAIYEWKRWVDIIRENQPNCVIFGCQGATPYVDARWVGNELGYAAENCYATIDALSVEEEILSELKTGKADGERFIPAECDTSIRPGWFYHPEQDTMVKSPEELVNYWFCSAGRNTAIALNIPVNSQGLLSECDVKSIMIWEKYLKEIFKENLLHQSVSICENVYSSDYGIENLLCSGDNKFYVSNVLCPTITFEFSNIIEFNCIKIQEVIEFGHRIRGIVVEYFKDGKWTPLVKRECIGFCYSQYFETVSTKSVRIRITDAKELPMLRHIGIYNAPAYALSYKPQNKAAIVLTDLPTAKIIKCSDGYEVDFGGIYPFNKVVFNATGVSNFEILVFNGSNYELIYKGYNGTNPELCTFNTIEGSYKLKIVINDNGSLGDRKIRVCYE